MKKVLLTVFLVLFFPVASEAATRDFIVNWSQECVTVDGDSLDADGDGICEMLNGFRFYDDEGNYLDGIVEDGTRSHTIRYNAPWGTQCHTITATMDDPINVGEILESDFSNVGSCRDVVPGRPVPPVNN